MRPILSEAVEMDPAVPKQLAVLQDSISCVNCVRFSPNGKLIASGSDDNDAFIHELREGRGFTVFGSTEAANVENWRLKVRLRGHEANVSDLAWSPSSTRLATASIDNKVKIWDASNGLCVRVLEGHAGHVKGVAWDPFDRFLASQGDREVIIWRLEDGAKVATIDGPFKNAPIASFALRPAWSPDGQLLTVPNGYDNGMHTAPMIMRNSWRPNEFQLVGHTAPVTTVRYNPRLFLPRKQPGGGSAAAEEDAASAVVAIGANDKQFSIWNPSESLPVCVGRSFFRRMIVDTAWSPDGRTLVIAAYDGTVTVATFAPGELGKEVPEHEVQELLAQLYGDPQLRNQKAALTAAPDLLQLEERARNDVQREQALRDRLGASGARAAAAGAGAGGGAGAGAGGPAAGAAGRLPLAGGAATAAPGLAAAAPVRQQQQQQQQQPPLAQLPQSTQLPAPNRSASPAKPGPGRPAGAGAGRDPDHPPAKRITVQPIGGPTQGPGAAGPGGGLRPGPAVTAGVLGAGASGGPGGAGADRAQAAGAASVPVVLVPPDPVKPCIAMAIHVQGAPGEHRVRARQYVWFRVVALHQGWGVVSWCARSLCPVLLSATRAHSGRLWQGYYCSTWRDVLHPFLPLPLPLTIPLPYTLLPAPRPQLPLELQAHNAGSDARGRPTAELVCVAGPARQWSDSVQGHIVSLAGSSRVAAVSTTNGDLLVGAGWEGRQCAALAHSGRRAPRTHGVLNCALSQPSCVEAKRTAWERVSATVERPAIASCIAITAPTRNSWAAGQPSPLASLAGYACSPGVQLRRPAVAAAHPPGLAGLHAVGGARQRAAAGAAGGRTADGVGRGGRAGAGGGVGGAAAHRPGGRRSTR